MPLLIAVIIAAWLAHSPVYCAIEPGNGAYCGTATTYISYSPADGPSVVLYTVD